MTTFSSIPDTGLYIPGGQIPVLPGCDAPGRWLLLLQSRAATRTNHSKMSVETLNRSFVCAANPF
jgi:hypothetical protein